MSTLSHLSFAFSPTSFYSLIHLNSHLFNKWPALKSEWAVASNSTARSAPAPSAKSTEVNFPSPQPSMSSPMKKSPSNLYPSPFKFQEPVKARHPQLLYESKLIRYLQGARKCSSSPQPVFPPLSGSVLKATTQSW